MSELISFKYMPAANVLRCLAEETAYFAGISKLNDVLEVKFDHVSASEFLQTINKTIDDLASNLGENGKVPFSESVLQQLQPHNEVENERFRAACEKVGIYSTSVRPDNQPMWAYYCNGGHGVCMELHWSLEIFQKHHLFPIEVNYSRNERVHNRAADFREVLLEVQRENPTWAMGQLLDFTLTEPFRRQWGLITLARAVSTKHADWQHEREIRVISPRVGPIQILSSILKRIYFTRTDFPEFISIIRLIHKLYPEVQLSQLEFSHKEPFVIVKEMQLKKVPINKLG